MPAQPQSPPPPLRHGAAPLPLHASDTDPAVLLGAFPGTRRAIAQLCHGARAPPGPRAPSPPVSPQGPPSPRPRHRRPPPPPGHPRLGRSRSEGRPAPLTFSLGAAAARPPHRSAPAWAPTGPSPGTPPSTGDGGAVAISLTARTWGSSRPGPQLEPSRNRGGMARPRQRLTSSSPGLPHGPSPRAKGAQTQRKRSPEGKGDGRPVFIQQCSVCCYASLFCDGVITSWLARCLGPSRLTTLLNSVDVEIKLMHSRESFCWVSSLAAGACKKVITYSLVSVKKLQVILTGTTCNRLEEIYCSFG
ncbi:uncharacterized protein ACIBXB_006766 [Morphnus guianensis]